MLTGRDFVVICELFTKMWRPVMRSNVENVKKRFNRLVLWVRTVLFVFVFSNVRNAPTRIVQGMSEIDMKLLVPTQRVESLLADNVRVNRRVKEVVLTYSLADVSGLKNQNGVLK